MKSLPGLSLAALCAALLAAPICHAQNTTPDAATQPDVHLQFGNGESIPDSSWDIPSQPGLTLGKIVQNNNVNGVGPKWADLAHIQITHGNGTQPATVDYPAIAAGNATDVPLSPGDTILIPMKPFKFDGGSVWDLCNAVQSFFGADWSMAVIPDEMNHVRIPQFGIPNPSGPVDVISLYNDLGAKVPALGQWFYRGDLESPQLLILIPDKSADASAITPHAKAIAIADIRKNHWDAITEAIQKADLASQEFAHADNLRPSGQLLFQDDSKILLVIGSPAYLELADSVVTAFRENAKIDAFDKLDVPPKSTSAPPPSPAQ